MSTSIPEGDLSRVVSGIADSMAVTGAGNASAPAGQMAGEMVRNVALGIDQVLKAVFGNLHKHGANVTENAQPLTISSASDIDSDEDVLRVDITSLKAQIDGMRSEALRLMQSDNKFDRLRGKDELEVAAELFSLLSRMLEQQMQIQARRASDGVR
jgi:hypothetical protein